MKHQDSWNFRYECRVLRAFIIDEIGVMGLALLQKVCGRMKRIRFGCDDMFGCPIFFLCDDRRQLPPDKATDLHRQPRACKNNVFSLDMVWPSLKYFR